MSIWSDPIITVSKNAIGINFPFERIQILLSSLDNCSLFLNSGHKSICLIWWYANIGCIWVHLQSNENKQLPSQKNHQRSSHVHISLFWAETALLSHINTDSMRNDTHTHTQNVLLFCFVITMSLCKHANCIDFAGRTVFYFAHWTKFFKDNSFRWLTHQTLFFFGSFALVWIKW